MKIGKATGTLIIFLLTIVGLVYATTITQTTVTDTTWINGTTMFIDEIWIDGINYTYKVTDGVNGSFITPSRINTTEFRGTKIYVNDTSLYDYVSDTFFSPWIGTPVIDTGFDFPDEPLEAQLFFRTTDYLLYYYNSSHWIAMGSTSVTEPGGGAGGSGTLYFYADFEENDFTDITVNGGSLTEDAGGTLEISSTAYNASYSSNSSIPENHAGTARAVSSRWKYSNGVIMLTDLDEWYVGGAFYLKNGFDGSDFCYIMKIVPESADNSTFATLNVLQNTSIELRVDIGKEFSDHEVLWNTPAISEGAWHRIIIYVNATLNGEIRVWLDNVVEGAPDFNQSGDFRGLLNGEQNPKSGFTYVAGLIQSQATGVGQHNWILWDELKVTDDFDTVIPTS